MNADAEFPMFLPSRCIPSNLRVWNAHLLKLESQPEASLCFSLLNSGVFSGCNERFLAVLDTLTLQGFCTSGLGCGHCALFQTPILRDCAKGRIRAI